MQIWLSPIQGNKFSWCYGGEVDASVYADSDQEGHLLWGEASSHAQQLLNDISGLPTVFGCTVGDIINTTPKKRVSSVALEEKFYETWHTKRVVLLGDGK